MIKELRPQNLNYWGFIDFIKLGRNSVNNFSYILRFKFLQSVFLLFNLILII
jgi:hypothetical protein